MRVEDRAVRERAATDFRTNLVVLAGAGTGKTSLLVERVLCAVGSGTLAMERIAAITFTEKAAGELRERLALGFERLRRLARGESAPDEAGGGEAERAYAWLVGTAAIDRSRIAEAALDGLGQLEAGTVSTIHAFCAGLLREFPLEAGVDPSFTVDAGEHAERLLEERWEAFLLEELGPRAPRPALWRALLERWDPVDLRRLAQELTELAAPPALLDDPRRAVRAIEALRADGLRLAARVDSALARQQGLSPVPLEFLHGAKRALPELIEQGLEGWNQALARDPGFASRLEGKSAPAPNTKLRGVPTREMHELLGDLRTLGRWLAEVDDEAAALAVEAVAPFVRDFREASLRAGFIGFDGLLVLTRDLLRDHPDVRDRVKQRYGMLLVDEFQDTDPIQYEIVLFLGEERPARAVDAFEAMLEPGRLFIVGDVKQSIYRFRRADYVACRSVIDRIEALGGACLPLTENFRSVPEVLRPVNALFEDRTGCWVPSPFQPEYVPIEAHRPAANTGPGVEVWTVACGEGRDIGERREAEGRVLADEIIRLEREKVFRYREVTVLLRAFTDISHYLRPLREAGIPFVVDGGRELLARPEVAQLLAALRTLGRPSDETALLAFLRSPAGAVSDVELARYAAEGGRWRWKTERPDPARFPRLARAFELLRTVQEETRERPADAVIRRLIERTFMLPLGAAAYEGAQRVANLQKLRAAAAELAADGRLSLDAVVDALDSGRLEDMRADRPLADDRAEAVRITTIHRMKGLENACIFLAGLSSKRKSNKPDRPAVTLVRLPGGEHALGVDVKGLKSSGRVHYELEELEHERAEETRVLYVALTRARERLVLLCRDDATAGARANDLEAWGYRVGGGKDGPEPPADGAWLAGGSVLHRHVVAGSRARPRLIHPLPETEAALERYASAIDTLQQDPVAATRAPSEHVEEESAEYVSRQRRLRSVRRAVGQAVHRVMEIWASGHDAPSAELVREAAAEAAREHGVAAREVEHEAREILTAFRQGPLWPIFTAREKIGREVPMSCKIDGELWHGTIDLIYRDEDGALVVADYKTDDVEDQELLLQRYGQQLGVYARAAQLALGLPRAPRTELWHMRSGARIPTV